jgi:hypothetical protein
MKFRETLKHDLSRQIELSRRGETLVQPQPNWVGLALICGEALVWIDFVPPVDRPSLRGWHPSFRSTLSFPDRQHCRTAARRSRLNLCVRSLGGARSLGQNEAFPCLEPVHPVERASQVHDEVALSTLVRQFI